MRSCFMRGTAIVAVVAAASCTDSPPQPNIPANTPLVSLPVTETSLVTSDAIGPSYQLYVSIPYTVQRNGVGGGLSITATSSGPLSTQGPAALPDTGEILTGWLSIHVPTSTPVGDHVLNVTVSNGAIHASKPYTIRVKAFRTVLISRQVALSQGATKRIVFGYARSTGVPAPAITVTGLPQGVTVSQTNPYDGTLTLTAASDAPLQTVQVSATATQGEHSETRQLQLTVQAARPKRPIAFRVCWYRSNPAVFGAAIGYANDGEGWTTVTPDADDYIRFDATEKVSIGFTAAYWHPYAPGPYLRVINATADELEQLQCPRASGTKQFNRTIDNADRFVVTLGSFRTASPGTVFGLAGPGPLDLVASAMRGTERLMVVRRGVELATLDTIRMDFAAPEAVSVDSSTIAISGGALSSLTTRLHTATAVGSLAGAYTSVPAGWYYAAPEALLAPNDVQSLVATTASEQTARGLVHYFRTAAPITGSFGPGPPMATVDTTANTITVPMQGAYPDVVGVSQRWLNDGRGVYTDIEVWQTRGYTGNASAWTIASPDAVFGGASLRPWALSNVSVAAASTGDASPAVFFGGTPAPGTRITWAVTNYGVLGVSLPFPSDR